MSALILNHREIRQLMPMSDCMDVIHGAFITLANGAAANPLRTGMRLLDHRGVLGLMPGEMRSPEALGLKVVAVFPGNHGTQYDSHQGLVCLFDSTHGAPIAIMDAATITEIRTGAASGVATAALARKDAGDLGILGSGVQASAHLSAMSVARTLRRVRVFSPNTERCRAFAVRETARHGIDVEVAPSAREAIEGADLICTTTSSKDPVLLGDWIAPGAHINAAGSSVKTTRELDTAAILRSRLYIDRRESTINEAGDYLFPLAEGAITEDHIVAEIGDVLTGRLAGRGSDAEITLYKSLGLAAQDVATAHALALRARARGVGVEVEIGGLREGFDGDPAP